MFEARVRWKYSVASTRTGVPPTLMPITSRERLLAFAHLLQEELFPRIEEKISVLNPAGRLLVAALEAVSLARMLQPSRGWRGRPAQHRLAMAAAFLAKAIYGLESTRQLIDRLQKDRQLRCLCGWNTVQEIPHESTFSRAFAEFAQAELPQRLHQVLIDVTQGDRLIGHISRDSTAIEARERMPWAAKPPTKSAVRTKNQKKKYTPVRNRRLTHQRRQTLATMLKELPQHCSLGVRTMPNGNQRCWRGYKLHLDVADGQIPISCVLTSASLHDSQAAIPLATLTAQRVTSLYDLMDSAYDANDILAHSRSLGHVPIVPLGKKLVPIASPSYAHCLRRGDRRKKLPTHIPRKRLPLTPAEEQRFKIRTMSERVHARLKDEFGGRTVRVRGPAKVMAHLMFGILALTVDQLLRLAG
jgi:transposase